MNRAWENGHGRTEKRRHKRPDFTSKPPHNLIWGRNPVLEWLESGLTIKNITLSSGAGGRIIDDILKRA